NSSRPACSSCSRRASSARRVRAVMAAKTLSPRVIDKYSIVALPSHVVRVLITGASSGIGRALALRLGGAGAAVGLAARRADELERVAAEIGPGAVVLPADLAERSAADDLAERALAALGGVDVLVNNAGTTLHGRQ